jgi:UDP-glucose 4-epimerase
MDRVGINVAVTGPTGEIGISAVTTMEHNPAVDRIVGMARRPFDPSRLGWTKTTYRQGDILDRQAVDELVADADVVIHLAFIIMGSRDESAQVNLAGTRNIFEATVAAERPRRLVYTSSVAAYGYHSDNPVPLTEDVPRRGSPEHYYSEQKAACEAELAKVTKASSLEVFTLRPCIVAGPKRPRWPARCRGGTCRGWCSRPPARFPCSRCSSPTRDFRCSWCTMTTSPPRSL